MTAKQWLEVMQKAEDFDQAMTSVIVKYGDMRAQEAQPSPPSAENKEREDELWEAVREIIIGGYLNEYSNHYVTKFLKSKYSITINPSEQLKNNPTDKEGEDEIKDIDFIVWYSGMDEQKIKAAYERYKKEIEQGQP